MKKQTVFVASKLSGFVRISCVTALLFTLSACGGDGSGGESGTGNGSSSAPAIKFLAADDGVNGVELWKTDGTAAGTMMVKDINTTPGAGSFPYVMSAFTEFSGAFYFQADDGVHGQELWKTDGTADGTVMVKDINTTTEAGSLLSNFIVLNNTLYFQANDRVHGWAIWKTDGTTAGTVLVKDINTETGVGSDPFGLSAFTEFNGALYFSADDVVHGDELWKTDGTAAGTVLVADINTAAGAGSYPIGITKFNGALYFQASDGVNGGALWKTDGTAAGTVLVTDINTATGVGPSPFGLSTFTEFNDALYFSADEGVHGQELWKTDGTAAGTVLVADINTVAGASSFPRYFTKFNGALYFQAVDGIHGDELWKTDGTAAGTVLVKDINPVTIGNSIPYGYGYPQFIVFNNALYFQANDGTQSYNNYELWKTDGTEAGTVQVKNINILDGSKQSEFTILNDALYFRADDGVNGYNLWKTDGTEAGTQMVKDFCPGPC